ncbi:MAG: serine/threonine protein kinase [Verrucomicrobia bacterium]|nr:serine/threonine protein kinase [Verrucomicrobiota bacterium]
MPGFEEGAFFADRYEIKSALGRGGMGMVHLAKDWKSDRQVALKTLLPKYAQLPQAVARFEREISAVRRIDHPAVIKIYDSGKIEGTLYYAMEYVDGKSVRSWMRERKKRGKNVGLKSTVRILGMVCGALEKAHEFTIHRDLSPENVMVTRDGQVKLLDFGLAKLIETDQDLTRVGVTLGKLQYSSPEQRADAKHVDSRTDLYALGVMFYELLSGELPMPGVKLKTLVPWLPPAGVTFVERAMANKPEDRFQTAREFREAMMIVYEQSKDLELAADGKAPRVDAAGGPTPLEVSGGIRFESGSARSTASLKAPVESPRTPTPVPARRGGWRGAWAKVAGIFQRRR